MASLSSLFSAKKFVVIKKDPSVIVSIRKRYVILPSLSPSKLYHHILSLWRIRKNSANALQTLWHPRYEKNPFWAHFKPSLLRCLIYLVLEWKRKSTNIVLARGVKIGYDTEKSGKNNNLLVITRVKLSQKSVWSNWQIWLNSKNEMARHNVLRLCAITVEFIYCYIRGNITTHTQVFTTWGCANLHPHVAL